MQNRYRFLNPRPLLITLAVLTLAACTEDSETAVVQITLPPDFTVSSDEVVSGMDQLGFQLALLERELIESEYNQINRQIVVAILQEMERIGSSLEAEDVAVSHPFLQVDMTAFVASLSQARARASSVPPSYYLAGKVAGGCTNCHRVNR